jgi:biopolymer transport protein TolQ
VFCAGYEELSKLAQTKEGAEGAMSERLGGIENVERALTRASTIADHGAGVAGVLPGHGGRGLAVRGPVRHRHRHPQRLQLHRRAGQRHAGHGGRPVGNALFATAAGLFAAIPAVVAYNSFVSRIKVFDTEMANFSADFLNIIKRHFFR